MFSILTYTSMQTFGGREHELHPAMNHAGALPPTRYTSTMGNEDPPHVAIVSVHFISLHASFADGGCAEGLWSTSTLRRSSHFRGYPVYSN